YITEALWPEFGSDKLLEAIYNYQKREQRFGR
ncbi:MAG: isoprenyl transferase, partial [Waddliaceae bacterium]|nr:isoprenyl transferase [Waddliaceae bacterium]